MIKAFLLSDKIRNGLKIDFLIDFQKNLLKTKITGIWRPAFILMNEER